MLVHHSYILHIIDSTNDDVIIIQQLGGGGEGLPQPPPLDETLVIAGRREHSPPGLCFTPPRCLVGYVTISAIDKHV